MRFGLKDKETFVQEYAISLNKQLLLSVLWNVDTKMHICTNNVGRRFSRAHFFPHKVIKELDLVAQWARLSGSVG